MTSKAAFGPVLARHVQESVHPLIRESKQFDLSPKAESKTDDPDFEAKGRIVGL